MQNEDGNAPLINGEWYVLTCIGAEHSPYFVAAVYDPDTDPENPWRKAPGHRFDGKTAIGWTSISDIIEGDPADPKEWKSRLCKEYWSLSKKIEKLEKTLCFRAFVEDHARLLFEQRDAMLKYKDILFRRLYDVHFNPYDARGSYDTEDSHS